MKSKVLMAAAACAACMQAIGADSTDNKDKFERVQAYVERNATNKTAFIRFEVTGPAAGLASLKVLAPGGRSMGEFKSPDAKLGFQRLTAETPIGASETAALADFPLGTYTLWGNTLAGDRLETTLTLSHTQAEPPTIVYPKTDSGVMALKGVKLKWTPGKDARAQIVVVSQAESGVEVKARLAGDATTFSVPDEMLLPDSDYKMSIGSVGKDGGVIYVQGTFKTRKK